MKRSLKLAISLVVRIWDVARGKLARLTGRLPAPTCVVLYYHAVPAQHRERFARQMDLVQKLTRPLPAAQTSALNAGQHYAIITFDDGFVSVMQNAAPELQRRQIPWTMFVPSGCFGQTPAWLRNAPAASHQDRVMTRDELRALVKDPLVTIGSHTVAHAHLVEVGPDRAAAELADSKAELERIVERPVDQFSYPFGARSAALDEQARALGYRRLFSTNPIPVSGRPDEFVLGRIAVDPDTSPLEFRLKLLGAYRWLAKRDH